MMSRFDALSVREHAFTRPKEGQPVYSNVKKGRPVRRRARPELPPLRSFEELCSCHHIVKRKGAPCEF